MVSFKNGDMPNCKPIPKIFSKTQAVMFDVFQEISQNVLSQNNLKNVRMVSFKNGDMPNCKPISKIFSKNPNSNFGRFSENFPKRDLAK